MPFCGKSLDMLWLVNQGLNVLGIDVSALAVEQFFADNELTPKQRATADGLRYSADNIDVIVGDLFSDIREETLGTCSVVYDRGAIVAQPQADREQYVARVYGALPRASEGLILTLEYPQAEMDGPPFCVDDTELHRLFDNQWDVARLECRNLLDTESGFRRQPLNALNSVAYHVKKH